MNVQSATARSADNTNYPTPQEAQYLEQNKKLRQKISSQEQTTEKLRTELRDLRRDKRRLERECEKVSTARDRVFGSFNVHVADLNAMLRNLENSVKRNEQGMIVKFKDQAMFREEVEGLKKLGVLGEEQLKKMSEPERLDETAVVSPRGSRRSATYELKGLKEQRKLLTTLFNDRLTPNDSYEIENIVDCLEDHVTAFNGVVKDLDPYKQSVQKYISDLRGLIDYLVSNPIPADNNPRIAQYMTLLDEVLVDSFNEEVQVNMAEVVNQQAQQVSKQIDANGKMVEGLKKRHDEFLEELIGVEKLIHLIECRLKKYDFDKNVKPILVKLSDDTSKFENEMETLGKLLSTKDPLFTALKKLIVLLQTYRGINPLKDEELIERAGFRKKVADAVRYIEKSSDIKPTDDREFKQLTAGIELFAEGDEKKADTNAKDAPPRDYGLRERANEMLNMFTWESERLVKLLEEKEVGTTVETIFNKMRFYDTEKEAGIKAQARSDLAGERNKVDEALSTLQVKWDGLKTSFKTNIPEKMNPLCSAILTKQGQQRGMVYSVKGALGGNTQYVKPLFVGTAE